MEDFTSPGRFFQNGSLNVPCHDGLIVRFIAIDDIGAFAALAFADPGRFLGQAIEITGDRLTAPRSPTRSAPPPAAPSRTPRSRSRPCGERAPEAAKVSTWANERYFDTDLTPLRRAHPGLMDFTVWLNRTGQARLLVQLESTPA
jgi:hypothetical protein